MNISDGPESGLMPTEKAAGNIMSPASIATSMSINAIWQAVFDRLALRLKYEAYVHRHAVPSDSEKNA